MEYSSRFMRVSTSGKHVGVLKYRDGEGRWRQLTRTFTRDAAESEALFAEWLRGLGARRKGGRAPTVSECVAAALEGDLARGRVERSTYEAQMGYARAHIDASIGGLPVDGVSAGDVQRWVDGLARSLSPSSARIAWQVARKGFGRARLEGWAGADPCAGVSPPRPRRARPACLEPAARSELALAVAREWGAGSGRAAAVALGLYAGLRCGECCGLRWRDAAGGEVRVRQAVGRRAGGGYLKAPKSPASARDVPVAAPLAAALAARRDAVGAARGGPDPSWFVCGEGPSFASPKALSAAFSRLCARAGVLDSLGEPATFHTLRHTFATVAVAAGVDVKTLSAMLGHASAKVTLDVYASCDADARAAAAARMEAAWRSGDEATQ